MECGRCPFIIKCFGAVIVEGPAAICHNIIEFALCFNIFLDEDMIAYIPDIFPFAGECADPFQIYIFRIFFPAVLGEIPNAVCNADQFIPDFFCIANGVQLSAIFHPPEIIPDIDCPVKSFFFKFMSPGRHFKWAVVIDFFCLDQDGISHCFFIFHILRIRLIKFFFTFSAGAVFCAAETENGIAGTVGKIFGFDFKPFLCGQLPRCDRCNSVIFRDHTIAGAIQQQFQIFLPLYKIHEQMIPYIVLHCRIVPDIFQLDFFEDTGFLEIFSAGTANPHADFTGSITAEDWTILNQYGFCSVTGSCNCGTNPRHSTTNDAKIIFQLMNRYFFCDHTEKLLNDNSFCRTQLMSYYTPCYGVFNAGNGFFLQKKDRQITCRSDK